MKLITKISLFIILGFLSLVLLIGFSAYTLSNRSLQQEIAARQLVQSRETMEDVDQFLFERYLDVRTIADSFVLAEYVRADLLPIEAKQRFENYNISSGPWDQLLLVNTDGRIKLSTEDPGTGKTDQLKEQPELLAAFTQASTGKAYYSDLLRASRTGQPTVIFATPIFNLNDQDRPIVGVVIGQLSWSSVLAILENVPGPLVYLYNQTGTLIGTNVKEEQAHILTANHLNKDAYRSTYASRQNDSSDILPSVQGDFESLTSFVFEQGYGEYRGNRWRLLLETPVQTAFAPARRASLIMAVSFIPFFTLSTVAFLLFLRLMIIKPLEKITQATKIIARGNLDYRIAVTTSDEIGELSSFFNVMIQKLKSASANLDRKVKIRTAELEQSRKRLITAMKSLDAEKVRLEGAKAEDDAILGSIADGVMVVNKKGNIALMNQAAEKMLGWKADGSLGKKWFDVLHREDERGHLVAPEQGAIQKALSSLATTVAVGACYYVRKDGTRFPVVRTVSPIILEGKIIGAINVFRDITHEKAIDKAKTEFVSLASHQLRTPLTAIRWHAEMLLAGDVGNLSKEQKRYITEMYRGNRRMIDLVDALLNVSRIELGTFAVDPVPTDFAGIAKIVIKELRPMLKNKKLKIKQSYDSSLPLINADPKLVQIIFQNLLSNAIKYTPEKGSLMLSLAKRRDQILITIRDTGYGIPKNVQHLIFTKLFRADNIRTQDTEGTGLGLYVTKAIVEQLEGKIWFISTENQGTSFFVQFPLRGMKKKEGVKGLTSV